MAIKFYKQYGPLGYLATYSEHGFFVDGIYYKTSEHYYQSKKFDDPLLSKKVIEAKTPKEASNIGRDRNNKIRPNWKNIKRNVMYEAVMYKFLAHPDIQEKLLATGNEEIIEETTKENYWGIGPNYDGTNYYGKILCSVRENLRRNKEMKVYFTREGYKKLVTEIDGMKDLHDEIEKKMGESVKRDNDLRENPEYMALRVKAMYDIPNKNRELLEKLRNAVIIEDTDEYKNWEGDTVIRKCKIEIAYDDGFEDEFTILGHGESDLTNNIMSCDAPLILELLGHKEGETIDFKDSKVTIKKISKIDELENSDSSKKLVNEYDE